MRSKYKRIKCPDGTYRLIHKNPNDIFPLIVSDLKGDFNASVSALDEMQAEFGGKFSNEIRGFLYKLDNANSTLQLKMRSVYSALIVNPCSQLDWYNKQIENIIEEEGRLRELLFGIVAKLLDRNVPEDTKAIAIKDASEKLTRSIKQELLDNALNKASINILKWSENPHEG